MTITMHATQTPTLDEMRAFIDGSNSLAIKPVDKAEAYGWISRQLKGIKYASLNKRSKGVVIRYLMATTGYKPAQIKRLIGRYVRAGNIRRQSPNRNGFQAIYTRTDITCLTEVDIIHDYLSGPATVKLFKRAYELFGDERYERLRNISVSHLYNLRGSESYRRQTTRYVKTRPVSIPIGQRVKPEPGGQPGYIRVDTVHQGDKEYQKGIYHINLVDEVTQWEVVVCVEAISERYMLSALATAIQSFPFVIINFHSDNGSEYINKVVAALLERMRIKLTKSRPRHSNDNGLVESKNGHVVRKAMGYAHIPRSSENVALINLWYCFWFVPYLNFHRPCAFRTETLNRQNGKRIVNYPHEAYQTPYEKLKGLKQADKYLRAGMSFARLNKQAYAKSDTDWAKAMSEAKDQLFKNLKIN